MHYFLLAFYEVFGGVISIEAENMIADGNFNNDGQVWIDMGKGFAGLES